ncbi:MAG TPA: class I SAM-dependent methyltransferase [Smithellaceae bacterium]|nr:class I SAM-dependent methyltransferase [Smithellaceae bacterium]
MWNTMGSVYNKRIQVAIAGLYERVAREVPVAGLSLILDAGSGRGYISLRLAANNRQSMITGVDFASRQVASAEKLRREKNIPNCAFIRGNVMNLPFQESHFDAAVSVGSIKHWPDGVGGLREIHRVLKPGATLVIAETDQAASEADLRRFIERFKIWFIPDRLLLWGLKHVVFGQSYSQETLARSVEQADFRNIECLRAADCPYVIVKALK